MDSNKGLAPMGDRPRKVELTTTQKNDVEAIFARFDTKNLNDDNVQTIMQDLENAGIVGPAVMAALESAGISPKEFLGFGKMGTDMGGSLKISLTDDQKDSVKAILAKFDTGKIDADMAGEIFKELEKAGFKGLAVMEAIKEAGIDPDAFMNIARSGKGGGRRGGHRPPFGK